jgi:hypothetical protein
MYSTDKGFRFEFPGGLIHNPRACLAGLVNLFGETEQIHLSKAELCHVLA